MEEPAQGVGAHAPPSQAHGMKRESPGLSKESQMSPQPVKRPLEPAIGLENGDAKRLKLAESAPEEDQTPRETPAPQPVQPDSELSSHEPMQIHHHEPKPEPAPETAPEQAQKTAAEATEAPAEVSKPEPIQPPLPLSDTNSIHPPLQLPGTNSIQSPIQVDVPKPEPTHPPLQLPGTNSMQSPIQVEVSKPDSIHPPLQLPDTKSSPSQAAPESIQPQPPSPVLVPESTSGPEPEHPLERKSSFPQIPGSVLGPTSTFPPASNPTQNSEQPAAHEPAQDPISAPAPQPAAHEPVPEPVLDQGHGETPMDMDLDLDAMVQDVLGDINNQMSSFQSIESPPQPDTNGQTNAADHPLSEPTEPPVTFLSNPVKATQLAALPSLANLGVHILLILSQRPVHDLHDAIRTPGSETAEIWASIKSLFLQTRSLFSRGSPILREENLLLQGATDELRIANLASLCCSLTSTGRDADSADRLELYSAFFPIVLHHDAELSRRVADLFVATKTQAVIDSVARGVQEKPIDQIIDEAFPAHLEQVLTRRHEGLDLTDTERFLVRSAQERKDALLSHIAEGQDENRLRLMYNDIEVFQLLSSYLHRELASYGQLACKYDIEWPQREASETPMPDPAEESEMDEQALESLLEATDGLVAQYLPNGGIEALTEPAMPSTEGSAPPVDSQPNGIEDGAETSTPAPNGIGDSHMSDTHDLFAEIEHQTQEYVRTTLSNLSPTPYQPTVPQPTGGTVNHQTPYLSHLQQHTQNSHPPPSHYFGYPPLDASRRADGEEPGPLPPTQSLPSAVLYDRARQAALSKNTNPQRREGGSSTRRPWTQDEEKALMMGLDKVQGPHWSQILSLYGPGGSISNILKDRSQVQLKDKARNLKLFFLKSNSEMPYYLQAVTGELKTRAPGQAARKEAEEKARQKSEEIQVRPPSALAMTSGLQSSPQSQPQASPVNAHPFHDLNHLAQATAAPATSTAPKPTLTPNQAQQAASATAHPAPSATSPVRSEVQSQSTASYNAPAATATASQGPTTPTVAAPYTPTYTPPISQPQSQPHTQPQTPASYTPTQSFTPTQPPPIDSPQVKAEEPLAELAQHMAAEEAAAAAAATAVSAAGSVHETSVANTELPDASHPPLLQDPFEDHDDLKDAALMQSLRELEAYSGTSVS